MVFKSDVLILSKSGIFVGKRYFHDDFFKMNIMTNITNIENNDKIVFSFYLLESYDVWHGKLGHVNYNFMQRLINHELILSIYDF